MRIGGKGTPWLAHKVFPSPQAPHPSPTRFFQEDETLRRRCRFPRGNRPPGTRKKEPPEASQRDNSVSNSKSPPYWRAFWYVRQNRLPKKTVSSRFMPNQRRPEDRHSRIPRSVASRRTRPRRELQDSRSYACGCAPNVQLLRKRNRQHLTKAKQRNVQKGGERLPGTCDTGRRTP